MKKATDRDLLDKELKGLNRKIKVLARAKQNSSVYSFMFAIDVEIRKRLKKNADKPQGAK